jgi:hypothetical protein
MPKAGKLPALCGYTLGATPSGQKAYVRAPWYWVLTDNGGAEKWKADSGTSNGWVNDGVDPKVYAKMNRSELEQAIIDADPAGKLRNPCEALSITYQGEDGEPVTEDEAAVIDVKRHPELLNNARFLEEHPELAPASYGEYGMVALGVLAIGAIIYIAYKAFKVKR